MKEKITELKQKIKPKQATPVPSDLDVKKNLEEFHQKFVIITIDKASNNFAFICTKHYTISRFFPSKNNKNLRKYSETQNSKEEIVKTNIKYCKKFDFKLTKQGKTFHIMYWLPKMRKTPIGARFIVALFKPLSDVISKVFKMIINHVEIFRRKTLFYTCFKKFWVVKNSFPIALKLNETNKKKNAKRISTFDFTTLNATIPHNLLIKLLSEVINFVFKSKAQSCIGFSKSSIYETSKSCGRR